MNFKKGTCPHCGRSNVELMLSNNPLSGDTICFDCIKEQLKFDNLSHADFFCRTYNLPFDPALWMKFVEVYKADVFKEYTKTQLDEKKNQPNLAYSSSTHDIWDKANKEWEKTRSFMEILQKLEPIRDSYVMRGRLKWGEQYTFEELIKLDSVYTKTLKANRITNPLQKEAVKTLCKLQIEMDEAIRAKDAKSIKDFSSAWSTFAKQADLETMINETKTDDITTVSELYQYMEDSGFKFRYYDGFAKDEVDRTIDDIQNANRKLILEATGLQQTLEDMVNKRKESIEQEHTDAIISQNSLADILDFHAEDGEIATEDDAEALKVDFMEDTNAPLDNPLDPGEAKKVKVLSGDE